MSAEIIHLRKWDLQCTEGRLLFSHQSSSKVDDMAGQDCWLPTKDVVGHSPYEAAKDIAHPEELVKGGGAVVELTHPVVL